jgi:hypothetical protein
VTTCYPPSASPPISREKLCRTTTVAPSAPTEFPKAVTPATFCNTSPAFKGYQCENFEFSGLPLFRSGSGMWAACRKCSELVDAEKWSSLADRAVRKFVKGNAVPRQEVPKLWVQFTEIVRLFAEHRKRLA